MQPLTRGKITSINHLYHFHPQESVLNGRLEPLGTIDGFTAEIGASGSFCPKHVELPVTTFFYSVSDDDAPSSYFVSSMNEKKKIVACVFVCLFVVGGIS